MVLTERSHTLTAGGGGSAAPHAGARSIKCEYDGMPIGTVWKEYRRTRSISIRNFLVEQFLPLVRRSAERLHTRLPNQVDIEDLVSVGFFGLVDAIDSFKPEMGVKFETFSGQRIQGAMLDELRSQDRLPRTARGRAARVSKIRSRIALETGVPATEDEIAARLGVPEQECERIMRDSHVPGLRSLTRGFVGSDGGREVREIDIIKDERQLDPLQRSQRRDLRDLVTRGFSRAERLIVVLYYYEGMSMKEIGLTLDLSESRVSQMHTSILARLKAQMQHRSPELEPIG